MFLTLRKIFVFGFLGMIVGLALLFFLILRGSEKTILESAEQFRRTASEEIAQRITSYLSEAIIAVDNFEKHTRYGLVDLHDPQSIRATLLSLLLANSNISEASFTYGESRGFDADGNIQLVPATRQQITVFRTSSPQNGAPPFICRQITAQGDRFVSQSRMFEEKTHAWETTPPLPYPDDPTASLTFQTPASRAFYGQLLWTDLYWSQFDEALPEAQRRVEISVQKTVDDAEGRFAGVIRIGLLDEQVTRAIRYDIDTANSPQANPYRIFLCDNAGGLITGFNSGDQIIADSDGDLRVVPKDLPPEVAVALRQPSLRNIDADHPASATHFQIGSKTYLCTFLAIASAEENLTQGWIVGIVVPRDYYLGPLGHIRMQLLWMTLGLSLLIAVIGGFTLRSILSAHSQISKETEQMNRFEFAPSPHASKSPLRDVHEILHGLERAKTAMRAMGKYVPVDLVRRLYRDEREPILGGDTADLSVLFTDIKDFTSYAEELPPDRIAEILGRYLEVTTGIIQEERGTIDKYIGDAVMAFWNAPEPVSDHALLACRAALRCREALKALYLSPGWRDFPHFETRFGLHRCQASVGHFGAPTRFNYTAIGDGINLASRIEGLNKVYGTTLLASETVFEAARNVIEFRLIDWVAVKGKKRKVAIYEPLFERAGSEVRPEWVDQYEQGLSLYMTRDFAGALRLFEALADDPPSRVLAGRCREFSANPPPGDWAGVFVSETK